MAKTGQSYKKKLTEVLYKPLKGLTSKLLSLAEPDTMVQCVNFLFSYGGALVTRPGLDFVAYRPENTIDNQVDTVLPYFNLKDYVLFTSDLDLEVLDTSVISKQTFKTTRSGNATVFTTNNYKDGVVFKDAAYFVEGVSNIVRYSGGTEVTVLDFPKYETYGNPVSICQDQGRLFVVTDRNYLRYSAVDSDLVWEDRVLLGGTVTATTTSYTLSGSETAFDQVSIPGEVLAPGAGISLVLTNGTSESVVTIASVTSNTVLTLVSPPTIAGTDLTVYLVGIDYYEPIMTGDSMKCRFIRPFGNSLAVSRTSDSQVLKQGGITCMRTNPQNNTSVLLVEQRNMTQNLNVYPYSLCEYEDNLIFLAESGLYAIPAGTVYSDKGIKLELLSKDKIERELKKVDQAYTRLIKIHKVNNPKYNLLLIPIVQAGDDGKRKHYLTASVVTEGFEFTNLEFIFEINQGERISHSLGSAGFSDHVYFVGRRFLVKCFDTLNKYNDTVPSDVITIDSALTTIDNSDIRINDVYSSSGNITISRMFKTGLTSVSLVDWIRIQKLYFLAAEATLDADRADTYTLTPYTVGNQLSTGGTSEKDLLNISKRYEYSTGGFWWSADSTVAYADSTIITADSDEKESEFIVKNNSYFVNARSVGSVGLKFSDSISTGYVEVYGYGYSLIASKFV